MIAKLSKSFSLWMVAAVVVAAGNAILWLTIVYSRRHVPSALSEWFYLVLQNMGLMFCLMSLIYLPSFTKKPSERAAICRDIVSIVWGYGLIAAVLLTGLMAFRG